MMPNRSHTVTVLHRSSSSSGFTRTIMRAYYLDNLPGDQRLQHDSGRSVDPPHLRKLGVIHWAIPLNQNSPGEWESEIDAIAKQQGYKNRDTCNVTKEGLGDQYESKLKSFFEE